MWMQTVNRNDMDRVWIVVSNYSGADIGEFDPVFKYVTAGNAASIATNEGASLTKAGVGDTGMHMNHFLGIAYEDIPDKTETGLVQVYGYCDSARICSESGGSGVRIKGGTALRVPAAASVGFSSIGLGTIIKNGTEGATYVTALADVTTAQLNASPGYIDHVFIRAL